MIWVCEQESNFIWSGKKEITANRKKKQIEIVCGDILNVANEYD